MVPAFADSCGLPVHRVFNPKPSFCTGITKPTWGPLPPPIESWMPPSANAGTAPKCDHAFFFPPPHIRPRGPATAPGGVMLHHGPLPMDHVLHQSPTPYQNTTQPSLPSFQVRSNLVVPFPPVLPPASFILAGPWVLRNTMVRPPPDDNIVEWEPFSFPTASWAMLSVA